MSENYFVDNNDDIHGNQFIIGAGGVFKQIASPTSPTSGYGVLFPKSDNKWYVKTAAGVESEISTGGSSGPGGSNTQVQFNSSGTFGGSANLTFNALTDVLSTVNLTTTTAIISGLTTGYVPYKPSGALANSPIFTDGTLVGIGTATPDATVKFHVSGGGIGLDNNQSIFFKDSNGVMSNAFYLDATNKFRLRGLGGGFSIDSGGGIPLVRVLDNGNVGMGTTTPATTLDVVGDVTVSGLSASQVVMTDGSKKLVSANYLDQAVKQASSPTFAGLTLTGFSGIVKATAGVLSAGTLADSDIPNDITLDNITQITNRDHTDLSGVGTLTHGNIDSFLDQEVKVASSPTHVGLTLSGATAGQIGYFGASKELTGSSSLTWDYTNSVLNLGGKLAMTKTPGSGWGSAFNLAFGTSGNPLTSGDIPIIIEHHANNMSGQSYAIWIKTTGVGIDHSSGLVVENFGTCDGGTFAVTNSTDVGGSALAAFINHTADIHDQYALTMLNRHGRAMINQSQGTGETLEIRRNGNNSGTLKSGAHIFIDEVALGNYGHLVGIRMDANAAATATDPQILLKMGTVEKFRITNNGSINMVNNTAIWMRDSGGTARNILFLGSDAAPGTLMVGQDADHVYVPALTIGTLTGLIKGTTGALSVITDNSSNWDTAYTDRLKWDGGATGLVAATGRTSLGLGTADSPSFTGLSVTAGFFKSAYNTQTMPTTATGLAVSWNKSSGSAEVNFYNLYENSSIGFDFWQKTGASTASQVAQFGTGGTKINIGGTMYTLSVVAGAVMATP